MSLSTKDLYWVAGILEGEGYFGFNRTPRITLGMTDKDIVERAKNILNPKAFIGCRKGNQSNYKNFYTIYITGKNAASWMMTIYSLLGNRRKLAIKASLSKWKVSPFQQGLKDTCKYEHKLNMRASNGNRYCSICHDKSVKASKSRYKLTQQLVGSI